MYEEEDMESELCPRSCTMENCENGCIFVCSLCLCLPCCHIVCQSSTLYKKCHSFLYSDCCHRNTSQDKGINQGNFRQFDSPCNISTISIINNDMLANPIKTNTDPDLHELDITGDITTREQAILRQPLPLTSKDYASKSDTDVVMENSSEQMETANRSSAITENTDTCTDEEEINTTVMTPPAELNTNFLVEGYRQTSV